MNSSGQESDSKKPPPQEMQTDRQFPQEAEFFQQLQQYDGECWDALLEIYAPQLRLDIRRSLSKRSIPPEWAEDIEQETWLTAVRHIDNFVWESESKFYNWFRSIATYHVKNLERKLHNRYISLEEIDDDIDDTGLSLDFFMYIHGLMDDSLEVKFDLRENLEILDSAMQQLKPREREILLRRLLYKESVQQLAIEYGVKPETISVILVRAKRAILTRITSQNSSGNI